MAIDLDDQGHFGPFVIRALAFSNTPGLPNTPVNGIEVEGAGGGSAVVATAIGVSATSGSAVVAQAESKISPAVLANNDPGAGVVGISTVALGTNIPGAGVIGISTKSVPQPFAFPQATGVAGFTNIANGLAVLGECDAPTGFGVLGRSSRGIGVGASSSKAPALHARSTFERGGVFASGLPDAAETTTKGGIAQMRLVPAQEPKLPAKGAIGDLYLHRVTSQAGPPIAVNLYLCVNDAPVQWKQVQLGTQVFAGGAPAP